MNLPLKIAFWATVAGQIILLLTFIAFKEDTLRSGTSVLLETAPVDSRSIMQRDFAILDYKIAELPDWAKESQRGDQFYVQLYEDPSGVWITAQYTQEEPEWNSLYIKGTVNDRQRLAFGIWH